MDMETWWPGSPQESNVINQMCIKQLSKRFLYIRYLLNMNPERIVRYKNIHTNVGTKKSLNLSDPVCIQINLRFGAIGELFPLWLHTNR